MTDHHVATPVPGITNAAGLACDGHNSDGQLGDQTTTQSTTFVTVIGQ